MNRSAVLGLVIAAASAGCGLIKSESSGNGPDQGGEDGGPGAVNADGSVVGSNADGSLSGIDAGPPNAQCPTHYSVYGNQDAASDLGGVNPTLISSGMCTATNEQFTDGGFGATDFTMTFAQSSSRSGMFMATLHQTTPYPYDLTVCLLPDGPNTGSKETSPGAKDGTMILTNVPEDAMPWDQYPKVVFDTNFQPARQFGDFMDITLDATQRMTLGSVKCTFVTN